MRTPLKGPAKFYAAGVIFSLAAIAMAVSFIQKELYLLLAWPVIFLVVAAQLFRMGRSPGAKNDSGYDVPRESRFGFFGSLFALVGLGFLTSLPYIPDDQRVRVIIPAGICFVLGSVIVIASFRKNKDKKLEQKRQAKIGSIVGAVAALLVLVPFTVVGVIALVQGKIAGGIIFIAPGLILGTVFAVIRLRRKRNQ